MSFKKSHTEKISPMRNYLRFSYGSVIIMSFKLIAGGFYGSEL